MPYLKFSCCGRKWKERISPAEDPVAQCMNCDSSVVAELFEELEFYCEECDSEWLEYWPEDTDDAPVSQCEYCESEIVAESYEYLRFFCKRCRKGWGTYLHEEDDPVDDCSRCHREVRAKGYQRLTFLCEVCDWTWSDYWHTTSDDDRVSECEGCGALIVATAYEYRQFACGDCEKKWWTTVPQHYCVCFCFGQCGRKLKPIPRDKEYGIGEHLCECGHTFHSRTQANVSSPCFKCDRSCLPRIIPGKLTLQRKSRHTHWCSLCRGSGDCINFHRIIHTSKVVR